MKDGNELNRRRPKSFSDVMQALEQDGCHLKKQGKGYVCECHLPGCGHSTPQGHLGIEDGGDKTLILHFPELNNRDQFYKDFCAHYQWDSLNYHDNNRTNKSKRVYGEIEITYPYHNADGKVLFEVVRYRNPKGFSQRRPDPQKPGEYIWGLKGVRPVLYHLPDVIAAVSRGDSVYLTEGEKDADNISRNFGFTASCNPMGAGKWRDHYSERLIGAKEVRILSDNDQPGQAHAALVASTLHKLGIPVKVLDMPKPEIKDITDWISAGLTRDQLLAAFDSLPPWEPPKGPAGINGDRPQILKTMRSMLEWVNDALEAVKASNNPPQLFVRSGRPVRVTEDEFGRPMIGDLQYAPLKGFIERSCQFVIVKEGTTIPIPPPEDVVRDILEYGPWPFPPLTGISEVPTIREDGSIHDQPGYDPGSRLYYKPAPGLTVPPIPANPAPSDLNQARDLLWKPFAEFPFVDDASRANTMATLLTPILLPLINGCCPMPIIDKPQAGTGATLCAKIISIITTGNVTGMTAWAKDEEALAKKITAQLLAGRSVIIFDNIDGKVYSPTLAAVLTTQVWEDRILGRTEMVKLPNRAIWIGTGNNITLGGDLPRRCIWIRMDAKRAQPWTGRAYSIPNLEGWVQEYRGELIAAALTLARGWIRAGKPLCTKSLGSFERWVGVIGGILQYAGVPGFLDNLKDMYETADKDTPQAEAFFEQWRQTIEEPVTAQKVKEILDTRDSEGHFLYPEFRESIPDFLSDYLKSDSFTRKLGNWLGKCKGVHYTDGLYLTSAGEKKRALLWKVCKDGETDFEPRQGEFDESSESKSPSTREKESSSKKNIDIFSYNGGESDSLDSSDSPKLPQKSCGEDTPQGENGLEI